MRIRLQVPLIVSAMAMMIPSAIALVPHPFWNYRNAKPSQSKSAKLSPTRLSYFDDCQRRGLEEWEAWDSSSSSSSSRTESPWIISRSEEKRQAMENLLGYNPTSAAQLSDEEIEDETLQWAVDCHIVGVGEDDEEEPNHTCKYTSLSDLKVASQCATVTESLAYVWQLVARLLQAQETNAVHLITFPAAINLWDYDVMVTLLQALAISKPLLPPNVHLQLDLFHPNYKHSPRMWSLETHAPFPTIGLQIRIQSSTEKKKEEEVDVDAARTKMQALFDAADADDRPNQSRDDETPEQALEACQAWMGTTMKDVLLREDNVQWMVDSSKEPYQLFAKLWTAVSELTTPGASTMLVAPHLDAHTTHRMAVTVNAALQRFDVPVRIVNVFHPNTPTRQSPHAMIQLEHT
jgi:hypothetical protein